MKFNVKFPVQESLTEEELERGLRSVVNNGIASTAMITLTGGIFLVDFALMLGASNLIVGLLASIPPLLQLIQLPSVYLIENIRNRRAICVLACSVSRAFWLFIALIPLLFSTHTGLKALILGLLMYSGFGAVSICSWNSWMRDLVPQNRLGSFFSKRMMVSAGLGMPLFIAAGLSIDWWKRTFAGFEMYGYSLLFFIGFLVGMTEIIFLAKIPESRMPSVEGKRFLLKTIAQPFRDANFKRLVSFLGSWNFAVNLAAPFFMVYMLRRLELDVSLIIILMVVSQFMNLVFLRVWGRISDHLSNKSVLSVSGPLFMLCIFAWTFTTMPEKHFLTVPLLFVLHIFMGISTAGVNLCSANIALKLAPQGHATSYLAATNFVNSLATGIAPILGGKFADFFSARELSLALKWSSPGKELAFKTLSLQHWDFFFLFAFLIGLYSIHRLTKVKEAGEVKEDVVIQELILETRKEMKNLSTVGGLYQLVQLPFSFMRYFRKNKTP